MQFFFCHYRANRLVFSNNSLEAILKKSRSQIEEIEKHRNLFPFRPERHVLETEELESFEGKKRKSDNVTLAEQLHTPETSPDN